MSGGRQAGIALLDGSTTPVADECCIFASREKRDSVIHSFSTIAARGVVAAIFKSRHDYCSRGVADTSAMDYRIGSLRTEDIARRWIALAQRRRDHLEELHQSGRWRKYYTEQSLLALKRETEKTIRGWAVLIEPDAERVLLPVDTVKLSVADDAPAQKPAVEPALS
jgi:hypothetical protein